MLKVKRINITVISISFEISNEKKIDYPSQFTHKQKTLCKILLEGFREKKLLT